MSLYWFKLDYYTQKQIKIDIFWFNFKIILMVSCFNLFSIEIIQLLVPFFNIL